MKRGLKRDVQVKEAIIGIIKGLYWGIMLTGAIIVIMLLLSRLI